MGFIFSRFRRKKSTEEVLEEIQSDIQSLEENREITLQRQKFWIGRLYIYSIILYVVAAAIFYFCFFPTSLADRFFYVIPLLVFPVIVILLKKFITWYYKREIVHGKDKLTDLKAKKKKILEDVMNKETYKVAKEILEKYAPEQLRKSNETSGFGNKSMLSSGSPMRTSGSVIPQSLVMKVPGPPPPPLALTAAPPPMQSPPKGQHGPFALQRQPSPQRRLIRPIIPRERNLLDKFIESLVGDGPNNRYALICRNCASHNGMALKEEFEYLAFRCAYCGFPNPAHKVRPRPSVQLHSRGSSEERKSVDGRDLREKLEERATEGDEKSEESSEVSRAPSESGGEGDEKSDRADGTQDPEEVPKRSEPPEESNESCASTADGVRPRKPLQVTDD